METGHGRVERRTVSLWTHLEALPEAEQWSGLRCVIRVESHRHQLKGQYLLIKQPETRYYISSLTESVEQLPNEFALTGRLRIKSATCVM